MSIIERLVSEAERALDEEGVSLDWSFPHEREKVATRVFEWLQHNGHSVPLESVKELYEEYAREVGA